MDLLFEIRRFKELSAAELYEVLRLRAQVFIVEQNCVYQDIDGKDHKALHLIGRHNGEIIAYSRLFKPGDYFADASIGRVVVDEKCRGRKLGHQLVQASIEAVNALFSEKKITISAQYYLKQFYEDNGFKSVGGTYLEDGIPHVEMLRS